MTKFLLFNLLGAVSLALVNSFFRANPYGWPFMVLLMALVIPTTLGTQLGFAKAYQLAPSFFVAWFVGTAFSAITGFLTSLFIFGEPIKLMNVLGMALIIGGAYCLIR
jgi:drug/metabolite transporter (DMT)-like permease